MSLVIRSDISAMATGLQASFLASGGTEPYVYSVVGGGAGGTIDPDSGLYTAPVALPNGVDTDPKLNLDTLLVTDSLAATATTSVIVTDALGLFREIIQKEMGLADDHVYLWDQKLMQPTDAALYVAVGILTCKPFGNTYRPNATMGGMNAEQSVNMLATLSIDVISRSYEAVRRKEEVLMALASVYAEQQQERNSFNIGRLPQGNQFVNLSNIDGSAIPYRFNISINMQYFARKVKAVPYFDTFAAPDVTTQS